MPNKFTSPAPKADDNEVYLSRVRPLKRTHPEPKNIYDLVIIGAGPAGIAAAELARQLGFSVALIERNKIGGNSLNSGSIPSKALIRTARVYATIKDTDEFGVPVPSAPPLDFPMALERMRRIRMRAAARTSIEALSTMGVDVFFGAANFLDAQCVAADGMVLRFRKALIATGARPKPSDIPGLDDAGYLTTENIFEMSTLPKRVVVIGGGPVGCELAQALSRMGSHVTIVQNEPKFLPREERDAAEILSRSMARDGVSIYLNTTVIAAHRSGDTRVLQTLNNDIKSEIETDQILLSIGRVPNIEGLHLEAAAIAFDAAGIKTDDFFRTENSNVYAAGDVCMELKFTNAAQASARAAVYNALAQGKRRLSELIIPWCTFSDPEIAHIGLHVWEARQQSIPIKSFTVMMEDVDRATTDGQETGFLKIHVAEGTDHILGATIVASRASEMINEMSVIMSAGVSMSDLADIIHTYPTQSEAIVLAARAFINGRRGKSV